MISVVVPCYNEQEVLEALRERLTNACEKWGYDWEVVAVDDGSRDTTWEMLCRFQAEDPRWRSISFSRNFGHQAAVSAGLYHAQGDAVFIIDADLQDPPEELHRFIAKWEEGFDVIYGVRKKRKEGLIKRFSYWAFYRLMARVVPFEIPLDSGDFCLMSRRMVNTLNNFPERNRFVRGLRAWAGFKQVAIPYERQGRAAGVPKYTPSKLIKLALDGMISFSGLPLKMASQFGFIVSALAVLGILFTFFQRIFSGFFDRIGLAPVPGYATNVIAILFMGGVQLIFLGIIGEYLIRIFDEVKQRPVWIVREANGLEPKAPPR
ncbi:MAG: glycosyltransferase family 2 protein [Flavobacteriales bacterium]|nr:glycosyltransferase family 2 protein [Flavobacteriales bacterium]